MPDQQRQAPQACSRPLPPSPPRTPQVFKICALLAVGFGDAGAEVIAENMREGGDLNPMVPGKRTVRHHDAGLMRRRMVHSCLT
jgi:hypothetical protein